MLFYQQITPIYPMLTCDFYVQVLYFIIVYCLYEQSYYKLRFRRQDGADV
jgi:hypothetical protein